MSTAATKRPATDVRDVVIPGLRAMFITGWVLAGGGLLMFLASLGPEFPLESVVTAQLLSSVAFPVGALLLIVAWTLTIIKQIVHRYAHGWTATPD